MSRYMHYLRGWVWDDVDKELMSPSLGRGSGTDLRR